jgi:hypothetical protein
MPKFDHVLSNDVCIFAHTFLKNQNRKESVLIKVAKSPAKSPAKSQHAVSPFLQAPSNTCETQPIAFLLNVFTYCHLDTFCKMVACQRTQQRCRQFGISGLANI